MDWNREDPTARFAEELLRKHPMISYRHAVAAAEYSGVDRLPRDVFLGTVEKLGILRHDEFDPTAEDPASAVDARSSSDLDTRLVEVKQDITKQCAETDAMRVALLAIRTAVRSTLADPELLGPQIPE